MHRSWPGWWRCGFVLVLTISSCSKATGPVLYPVTGKVLVDGQPAARAHVFFHPLDNTDSHAPRPHAKVLDDGTFALTTNTMNDGAPAGKYGVTIIWIADEADDGPDRLQGRYADRRNYPWKVDVLEGENQLPTFQLKK